MDEALTARLSGERRQRLEAIAREPKWWVFARELRAATRTPQAFGFERVADLIAYVAELSGTSASALRSRLDALRIAEQTEIGDLDGAEFAAGPSHLTYFRRIHERAPDLARELKPRVYRGAIATAELKRLADQASTASGAALSFQPEPTSGQSRALVFQRKVGNFVRHHLHRFTDAPDARLVEGSRFRPAVDYVVETADGVVLAVEVKSGGHRHDRSRAELLGFLEVVRREASEVWLIVPPLWKDDIEKIRNWARERDFCGIHFGVYDDEASDPIAATAFLDLDRLD